MNVGSMSGLFSTPLLSVYSASKAYVHTFTDALRQEYAEHNIHFQVGRFDFITSFIYFWGNYGKKEIGMLFNDGKNPDLTILHLNFIFITSQVLLTSQVICPMFVSTAMTGMRPSISCPTPDAYARSAVATFGKTNFTCGYWAHSLQVF